MSKKQKVETEAVSNFIPIAGSTAAYFASQLLPGISDPAISRAAFNPTAGTIFVSPSTTLLGITPTDVSELKGEIAAANSKLLESQKQILSLQKQLSEKVSESKISELASTIQSLSESMEATQERIGQVQDKSSQLTAPLILPGPEDMKINLVPTHWLDHLEEYRSDENFVSILIGLFGGAFLGMVGAMFLSKEMSFSPYAIAFLILLLAITVSCFFFLMRMRKRSNELRQKMNNFSLPPKKIPEPTTT